MIKNLFFALLFMVSAAASTAQSVTKNLVYKSSGGGIENDGSWFYTVSPNGRFIVLGCGNYQLSKKAAINVCGDLDHPTNISKLQVYDTYEKKLNTIDLSSVFDGSPKIFSFTFSQGSNLFLAELSGDFFDTPDEFYPTEYKQKIVSLNLTTSMVESEFISTGGKVCTQLGYYADQVVCAQNTFRINSQDQHIRDLDLVFYDTKLTRVLKSVALSKDKPYTMMPQLNETEFTTDKSVRPIRILIAREDLGGGLHTTGDSFSIDLKTGDVNLIPELDEENQRSDIRFVGNYVLNNSSASLYLLSYYPKFDGPNNPPIKKTPQFLTLNKRSTTLIDAPKSWGDFDLKSVLGVSTIKNGLPTVFRSNQKKYSDDNDSNQLTISGYSLFTGEESTILKLNFDYFHFNSYTVWDDNSESFFLLNGENSESNDERYAISEIQQVDVDGVTIQKNSTSISQGNFYLNPRTSNPLLIEYDNSGQSLFGTIYSYSAAKRKLVLIDREKFNIPFGPYDAPLFVGETSLVLVSTLFDSSNNPEYSIYFYEY